MYNLDELYFKINCDRELFDETNKIALIVGHLNSIVQNEMIISGKQIEEHFEEIDQTIERLKQWKKDVADFIIRKENIVEKENIQEVQQEIDKKHNLYL